MKTRTIFFACIYGIVTNGGMLAQSYNTEINPVWKITLGKSEYALAVNSITSVLLQEYLLEEEGKRFRVVELDIETVSGSNTRIFWKDESNPQEIPVSKKKELESAIKSGGNLDQAQVKVSADEVQRRVQDIARTANLSDLGGSDSASDSFDDMIVKKGREEIYAKLIQIRSPSESQVRDLHQELLRKWL